MRTFLSLLLSLFSVTAFAQSYGTTDLPYSDVPQDRATAVAISALTSEGILQGNPDGTFRPYTFVNRAEFTKVAVMSYPAATPSYNDLAAGAGIIRALDCFPDVHRTDWFAPTVCAAKAASIVQGNLDGTFRPGVSVNYAEAVKILDIVYGLPLPSLHVSSWYEPYIAAAEYQGIGLPQTEPGHALTRGEVAQIVASFLAWSRGDLHALRAAQAQNSSSSAMCVGCDHDSHGCIPSAGYLWCATSQQCVRPWEVSCPSLQSSSSSKISISCDPYLCKDGNSYPSCTRQGSRISYFMDPCALNGGQINASSASSAPSLSSASSIPVTINIITDPDPDHSLRSTFLKLGSVSPVLAWAKAYSDPEPIAVRHITMTFDSAIRSMQQIILYTEGGFLIGRGTLYSADGRIFKMDLSKGDLTIPYRNSTRFYLRILTGEYDRGGTSGETAHVSSIVIDGTGLWSFADYSSETIDTSVVLPTSETARSVFNNISNAGPATDVLAPGPGRSLGSFSFSGTLGDPNAKLTLTSLLFSLSVSGGVTVSNPQIAARGSGQSTACSVINSTISCPALPEYIGSIGNSSKILDLSGDIAIASNVNHASLNVSLNPGGTVTSPGAASWTDGTTTFQWIPYDRVDGTNYQW